MKNSSKNVESRIGIRDSKFSGSLFTHTSSFIFEKNHVETPPFFRGVQKMSIFGNFWQFLGSRRARQGSKMRKTGSKIVFCSGNVTFYLILGVPTPPFFQKVQVRVRGSRGVLRVQNGVKSRVCSVNPIFSGVETPKIRGPGGVTRG